ncbi:hypothetical protein [Ornithinimicrobium cavernae]|uniref:hypothetical protein n=1 Tax=Ornithinimicrobium cavernae TaxID=2666047 RepID=UPI0012B1844B|nr:hypothetical protein [Ornithinimicrobium cavernae]
MYHLMEEQLARSRHRERTTELERAHRQKLAGGLQPTAQRQHLLLAHLLMR